MSYILDALKKSEQERGHGNVPGVQTVHTSSLNYKHKKAYWPYILITAVVLNLIVMLYFFLDKDAEETRLRVKNQAVDTPHTATLDTNQNRTTTVIDANRQTRPAPVKQRILPAAEPRKTDTSAMLEPASNDDTIDDYRFNEPAVQEVVIEEPLAESSDSDIITYHELDESIKQQLPAIIVSAHVYSTNPQQRSIVINNNFLEEGEYIIDGLILHEITPNGAILNYNGILFRSDIVSGWQ